MVDQNLRDAGTGLPDGAASTDYSRRQFIGALGAGAAASAGLPGVARGQETPVVSMGSNSFDPIGLSVEPGTTVRFEIDDGSHSATAYADRIPDGAQAFDSGVISVGSFEHTFEKPGTYDYYCIPHESTGMVGRIVVREPGGPAEASPIPNGSVPDSETIVDEGAVAADGSDGSSDGGHGGMMGAGIGGHGSPGWMIVMPLAFLTAVFGLIGALVYWVVSQAGGGSE